MISHQNTTFLTLITQILHIASNLYENLTILPGSILFFNLNLRNKICVLINFFIVYVHMLTEVACKTRLDLIKTHACAVLQDLKNKADNAYKDMNDWLGARFLKENER
jgi:hypothetical protein